MGRRRGGGRSAEACRGRRWTGSTPGLDHDVDQRRSGSAILADQTDLHAVIERHAEHSPRTLVR